MYPNYAYAQFCKSDAYYYDYVVFASKNFLASQSLSTQIYSYLKTYFNLEATVDVLPSDEPDDISADSLEEELKKYRTIIANETRRGVKTYEVLKNMQIALIVRYFPQSTEVLSEKCNLSDEQITLYGKDIIDIVSKYIRKDDFE